MLQQHPGKFTVAMGGDDQQVATFPEPGIGGALEGGDIAGRRAFLIERKRGGKASLVELAHELIGMIDVLHRKVVTVDCTEYVCYLRCIRLGNRCYRVPLLRNAVLLRCAGLRFRLRLLVSIHSPPCLFKETGKAPDGGKGLAPLADRFDGNPEIPFNGVGKDHRIHRIQPEIFVLIQCIGITSRQAERFYIPFLQLSDLRHGSNSFQRLDKLPDRRDQRSFGGYIVFKQRHELLKRLLVIIPDKRPVA